MARKPATVKAAPADLSELDAEIKVHEEGVEIPLLQIDGVSPLGFGIIIAGPESERYQMARDAMTREIVQAAAAGQIDDASRRQAETRMLSRLCMAFTAPAKLDGKLLENTEEDFARLMKRFPFIRRQIDVGQANRANFTLSSPEGSSNLSEEPSPENGSSQSPSSSEPGQPSGE